MTIFTPESTPMRDTAPTGIQSSTAARSPLTFWSSQEPYRAPGELKKNPIVPLGTQPATPAPEEPPAGSAKTIKDARNMVEDMQARIQYLGRAHRLYSGCATNFDVCHQMYLDALQALVAEGKRKIEEAESSKQAYISEPIDIPSAIKTPVSNVKFNPTIESKPTTPKNSCLSMAVVRRPVSVSNPITENTTRDSRNPTQVHSINVEEVFNILNRTKNPDQLGQFWRHAEPISLSASPLNGIACSTTRFRKSLSATPSNAMASPTDRLRMSMSPTPSNSTPCPINRFTELDDCQARTNPITKMINGALRVKRTLLSESSAGPTEPVTGPLVKRIRAREDLLITASAHLSGKPSSVMASLLVKPSSDPSQQHSSASDSLATNNKKAADFQKDSPHQTADTNLSLASDSLSTNNEKEADCQKDSPRQTTDTNLSLAVDSLSDPLSSDLSHHEATNAQKTSSPQKDLPAQTSDSDQSSAGVSILDEFSTAPTTDTNQSSASTSPANMLSSNSSQQTEKTNHPQKDLPAQTTDTNQSSASDSLSGDAPLADTLSSESSQQLGHEAANTEKTSSPQKDLPAQTSDADQSSAGVSILDELSTARTTDTNQSSASTSPANMLSSNSSQQTEKTNHPQKDLPAQTTNTNQSSASDSLSGDAPLADTLSSESSQQLGHEAANTEKTSSPQQDLPAQTSDADQSSAGVSILDELSTARTTDTNPLSASAPPADTLSSNSSQQTEKTSHPQKDLPAQTTDTNQSSASDSLSGDAPLADTLSSESSQQLGHEAANTEKTSSPQKDLPAQTSDADQSSAGVSILDELSTARTTDTNQSSASTSPANMLSSNSSQQTEKTNHPQKDLPAQTTNTNQSSASDSLSGELGSNASQQPANTEKTSSPQQDLPAQTSDADQSSAGVSILDELSTARTTDTNPLSASAPPADTLSSNSSQQTEKTSHPQKRLAGPKPPIQTNHRASDSLSGDAPLADTLSSESSQQLGHEAANTEKTSSPQKDLPAQTSDADQSSAGVSILDELSTARTTDTNQSSASTSPANMLSSNSSQQTEKTNHPQKDLPAQTTDTNQSSASDSLSGELGSDSSQQRGAKLPTNTKISSNPAKDSTAPTTDTNQSETNISPSLADEPSSNSTQLGQSNTNNTSTPQKDLPAQSTELNKSAPSTSQSNNLSSSLTRVPQEEDEPTPDQPDETTPDQQDETTPDQQDEPTPDQPDKANDGRPAREAALNSRKRTSQVSGGPSVPRKRPKPAKPSESEDVSVNQSNFDFLGEPINLTLLLKPEYLWREAAHINILHSIRQKKGDAPTYMMPMLQEIMPSIFHTQVHRATSLQCLQPSQTTNPKTREVLATSTELWSEKHVQMDVLIHGIDELLGKDRAGGWTALQSMMCRSSEKGHQNIFDFKQPLKEATLRIHQLVMDSTSYLQPDDGDLPQASHEDTRQEIECKGLGRVGVWLSDQVDKYEPKNKPDQHHKAHRDGMDFLMKRCWEMLHGGSIMHESYDTFTRKRHGHKAPRKVEQRASASKNGEDASASKNAKHDLHAKRLKSCSSLVLFLNFGVAGWFHCHMNRQRFNFQDLTSLMMLAQEMSLNGLSIRSPLIKTNGSTRKTTHEAIHRPWEQLNDYLIQLLIEIGLGNPRIDWWASVPICKARLQPDVLAPLVIKDFFSEILKPGDTLSSTGGPAPTPKYDESYLQTWQSRVKRLFLTPQKYARLQRDRFSNMGVTSPRRGEDEEDPETDDSDEDETDELDGKSLSGDDDEEGSEEDGEDEDAPGEEDEDAPGEEDEG
ncbi:uncharacterized protein PGTG_20834 [Puccinia graminis f. sp. tritici CRL 75-36-700-3]|uniref:Golgi to ER traffic-protein n=1 Tax=Puccinia graminis f. sp. tritici (strain CRL 75-36-700-3 / race SCCL) TaxID=418459 RepID=H6QPN5_PUCGT|nr:uncharacterized protein PGTG_20834 [Puccinia graminis f. sp. tritici CRL 75-36-700-3]EHS64137.1 hypothetical protein PGTG_20834 [Puccinia graminis f. sp. tritici CRL 75-36-700-3]